MTFATGPVVCLCPVGLPVTGQSFVSTEVVRYLEQTGHVVDVINKKAPTRRFRAYLASLFEILALAFTGPRPSLAYLTCSRTSRGFFRDALFIMVCRLRNVPTINHVHGEDLPGLLTSVPVGWIARRLLNGVAANVVLSHRMAADCARAGLTKTDVLQNFCADELFGVTRSTGRSGGPVRVLFLSNVMEAKGIFDLIEACRRVSTAGQVIELHVAGPVFERTASRQRQTRARFEACMARDPFLKWRGPVDDAGKLDAFARADIFCLPSHAEAAPISLLEAMAAGLPVVATRVGSVPEIAARGSVLVEPLRPDQLAEGLQRLAGSPALRAELGDHARAHVRAKYSMARFHEELGRIIDAAIQRGPQA